MLSAHPDLGGMERKLAWFTLICGGLTLLHIILFPFLAGQMLPPPALALYLTLGGLGIVAGYFALRARPWAYWLLFCVFLVQVVEYSSETLFFSMKGPVSFTIGWEWRDPPSSLTINFLAIVVSCVAFHCAVGMSEPGQTDARTL